MTRPEILDTAKKCVCGDREQDYGTPEQNFKTIADLWSAYLDARFEADSRNGALRVVSQRIVGCEQITNSICDITAVDVAVMMTLVKIGRIASGHGKADNWVDGCGYMACGGEIESAQDKPAELTQEIKEELFATVENDEGKYASWSNDELVRLMCVDFANGCQKCPLNKTYTSNYKCSIAFVREHPSEFRAIAIKWLREKESNNVH